MKTGLFISFEGGEGAGKSSVIAAAVSVLAAAGVPHRISREPGGTELAERVRELLLDPAWRGMAAETELLLMMASRAAHVRELIEPTLAAGTWLVSDRYVDASFAYQGGGRGVAFADVAAVARIATGGLSPQRTYLLDVPVEVGLARMAARGAPDRIESEDEAFFRRVRDAYRQRAAAEPQRFVVVDASRPLDEVVAVVAADLGALVARWQAERG